MRASLPRILCILLILRSIAMAADATPQDTSPPPTNVPLAALGLDEQSGPQAIAFGAYLLNFSVKAGSVLDANVSVIGDEKRDDRTYLGYRLDTGIVFDTSTVAPPQRISKIWTDIVEPAARKLPNFTLPGVGIALHIAFQDGTFTDRADIQEQLQAHQLHATEAIFYVLRADAAQLVAGDITARELASRTTVMVDNKRMELLLP